MTEKNNSINKFWGTTVISVRRDGKVAMAGDGQVSLGGTVIMKHKANKIRYMYHNRVLAGFAGASADAFALFERFEAKLEEYRGNLPRAAVELAKEWRTDRVLRRLEALLATVSLEHSLIINGGGDVIEPDDGIVAIGSGASFALAAARAYMDSSQMPAPKIVEKSLQIAASICVYTNTKIKVMEL